MKRIFWSEGSDVAAQSKSRVYVCDCVQGLEVAYRFEWFPPAKIQLDSSFGWEMCSPARTDIQNSSNPVFLHMHDYC